MVMVAAAAVIVDRGAEGWVVGLVVEGWQAPCSVVGWEEEAD